MSTHRYRRTRRYRELTGSKTYLTLSIRLILHGECRSADGSISMNIRNFWDAVLKQDAERLRTFFSDSAYVNWHCTDEHFTAEEYIRVNCEYPGTWDGTIERIERIGDVIISVVNVYRADKSASFHAVSFIKLKDGKIVSMDEYWADDGKAPQWRLEKGIGTKIHEKDGRNVPK